MTIKEAAKVTRNGGKIKSPTCPLTQGDDYIARRDIIVPRIKKKRNRNCRVIVDNGETIELIKLADILEYDDWIDVS